MSDNETDTLQHVQDTPPVQPLFKGVILTDPETNLLPIDRPFRLRFTELDAPPSSIQIQLSLLNSHNDSGSGWKLISDWQPLSSFSVAIQTTGPKALQIKLRCDDGRVQATWLGNYFFYNRHNVTYLPDIIHSITSVAPHGMLFEEEVSFVSKHLLLLFAVLFDYPEALTENGYYEFDNGITTARIDEVTATLNTKTSLLQFEGLPVLFNMNGLAPLRGLRQQVYENLGINSWDCLSAAALVMLVRRAYRLSKSGQMGVRALSQDTVTCGGYSAILIGLLRGWGMTANAIGYTGSGHRIHVMVEFVGSNSSLILDATMGVIIAGTFEDLKSTKPLKQMSLNLGLDLGYDVVEDFRTRDSDVLIEDINFIKLIPV